MKVIVFKIHICGMSERTISSKIMIDKPFKTITKLLSLSYCSKNNISTIDNLISYIKESCNGLFDLLGEFGVENFNVENIYIKHKGYLIGLQEDKSLSDVFAYFKKNILEFDYIYPNGKNGDIIKYIFEEYGETDIISGLTWHGKIDRKYIALFCWD